MKLEDAESDDLTVNVAPHAGAWIEMESRQMAETARSRPPRGGVD